MKITKPPGKANRRSFRNWMAQQVDRDDPIGDLAGDALRKSSGAWTSRTDLKAKMVAAGACAEAMQALEDAGKEFAEGERAHFKGKADDRKAASGAQFPIVQRSTNFDLGAAADLLFQSMARCPFCCRLVSRADAKISADGLDFSTGDYDGFIAWVSCAACGASGPVARAKTEQEARDSAIKGWDSRRSQS